MAHRLPEWRVSGGRVLAPAPFLVAGIVNLTPDSFSDGGECDSPAAALERIRRQAAEGAGMIDIGAESTRPGAEDIGPEEEWRRLRPVLREALRFRAQAPEGSPAGAFALAIDTYRAATAAKALSLGPEAGAALGEASHGLDASRGPVASHGNEAFRGVDVINDISGASFDPAMPEVLGAYKPGYVLGHCPARPSVMQRAPRYNDVVDELLGWFTERMDMLTRAGLPEACIALDPCIGFGKNLAHNIAVIRAIPRFAALGRPLYFGISRKSLLGELAGLGARERDTATQALTALLAQAGVAVHRVHQVAETVATLKIVEALW